MQKHMLLIDQQVDSENLKKCLATDIVTFIDVDFSSPSSALQVLKKNKAMQYARIGIVVHGENSR